VHTYEGKRLENPFRIKHGFGDRIVIMYSGNHSLVHQLDDILEVALNLRNDDRFLFVFIGGGIRTEDVRLFKNKHNLENIVQLPFQPRKDVHISLGSSDLQLVILGDGQVGYTHPNKLYGAIFIGKPVIYIGPSESHVQDIIQHLPGNISVEFGQVQSLQHQIVAFAEADESEREEIGKRNQLYAQQNFDPMMLRNRMVDVLHSTII
ncbi:MAG: glycosyltransferase WbuB, partial [Bacteroidia bacterium]|nr:glycosyltransferase WbuB [Bacteroidia bacterium]